MDEPTELAKREFDKRFQTTSNIVIVQIVSVLVLIAVAYFVAERVNNSVSEQAILLMWASIILLIAVILVLNKFLFSSKSLKKTFQEKGSSGVLADLQIKTIFICLVVEIIAIIGFLIATLSGSKFEMFRAGTVALVIFLFNFPRKRNWEQILTNLESIKTINEKT